MLSVPQAGLLREWADKIDKMQAQIALLLVKLRRTHTQKCPSVNDEFVRAKKSTKKVTFKCNSIQTQKFLSLSQEHAFYVSQSLLQAFSRAGCSILTRSGAFDSLINSGKKENQIIRITFLVFQKCCC